MKKIVILISLFCLVGCSSKMVEYKTISSSEAYDIMNTRSDIVILDVRTESEFTSGYIKNAINVPLDTIEVSIGDIISDKDKTILVYCRSGNRSKEASSILVKLGYTDVINFGGLNTWEYEIVNE